MGLLEGKIAVVTGASRGIGAEIARRFGAEGATVGVTARTTEAGQSPFSPSPATAEGWSAGTGWRAPWFLAVAAGAVRAAMDVNWLSSCSS
jgi:NAD(P)-dependent dehydrogenase (short-subunit alcohol dehydrogenase family)